jgi:elongation factor 2
LIHETETETYLINLIDTPGHVDFSGKVTRALRALDGCILLVDAVEEFQIMTEMRLRAAIEERVRPVLYINKIDRLIKEMKLDANAVQEKLNRVIGQFNNIITTYAEGDLTEKWKVNPANGSVAFGSALDLWGFTIPMMVKKGLKFSDIVDYYAQGRVEDLQKMLPLQEAILEMSIKHLPNPLEAQPFRIPKIWSGDTNSDMGKAMMTIDEDGPTVMCITQVMFDPHAGIVSTGRIFSGAIHKGDDIYLLNANKDYHTQQVSIYMGAFREVVDQISAGNIAAVLGLDSCRAGETIVDAAHKDVGAPFESLRYISDPVLTMAIEPKHPMDLPRLIDAMQKMSIQDPNLVTTINQETGEYLLAGMGELHLEIALKDLKREYNLDVTESEPTVVYREAIRDSVGPFMGKSPNKHNRVYFTFAPLDPAIIDLIRNGEISVITSQRKMEEILVEKAGWTTKQARQVFAINENANMMIDTTVGIQGIREVKEHISGGFTWALQQGPLAGEIVRGLLVDMNDVELHEDPVHRGPAQMMPAVRGAIYAGMLSARPTLLEPIYKIQVRVPATWLGNVTGLLSRKRGKVHEMDQQGVVTVITGFVPVSETIGFSADMRAATSGSAFWQSTFDHWAPVPDSLLMDVVKKIRTRKGMTPEPPTAAEYIVKE